MDTVKLPEAVVGISSNINNFYSEAMVAVEDELKSSLMRAQGVIKDMCIALLNSGGKRMRPLMVLNSGMCFSQINSLMIKTAAAAELIHMASLVHDDIIDNSDSRRGMSTINSKYGNHCAVLAGDYLFGEAFRILSSNKLIKSMEYLVEAIQEMCDGEVHQAESRFNTDATIEEYFMRIGKKTGILVSSCCSAGAASADASKKEIESMRQYGLNVGYAFQIIDDILDFTGDERKLGKPTGIDLMNGNITLPIILLLENPLYGGRVKKILRSKAISRLELDNINKMLDMSGCIKDAYAVAEKCIMKAKMSINSVKNSWPKEMLLDTADMVLRRNH